MKKKSFLIVLPALVELPTSERLTEFIRCEQPDEFLVAAHDTSMIT